MNSITKNRGELIDIARGFVTLDNHVIRREDIPEMVDEMLRPKMEEKKLPFNRENYEKEGVICKTISGDPARVICWDGKNESLNNVIVYLVDKGTHEDAMFEYDLDLIQLILTLPEPTEEHLTKFAMNWISHLTSDVKRYLSNKHFNAHPTQLSEAQFKEIWEREGCQEYANSSECEGYIDPNGSTWYCGECGTKLK